MTYPAGYNKKDTAIDNSSNNNKDQNEANIDNNINTDNSSSNNNSSNKSNDSNSNRDNINNNIKKTIYSKFSNKKENNDDDKEDSNITIKRSTFTKLAIIGVAALMVSSFFAGYTLHQGIAPPQTFVTLPSSTTIPTTANSTMPSTTTTAPTPLPAPTAAQPQPTTISSVSLDDDPIRGNKDASITLVEFSDYQCPFCKRTFDDTMPDLKSKYIDTGKIKHVYRDYPLPFHQNALPAAIAAECANEQGKFWDYHDILFSKQTEWENLSSGNATNAKFKEYATSNNLKGIDTNKFNACIDSQKYKDEVDKDIADASTYGVSGTPTFYIGNEEKGYTQIVGAQPLASFESIINKIDSKISNSTAGANNNSTNT